MRNATRRIFCFVMVTIFLAMGGTKTRGASYEDYDNETRGWGLMTNTSHEVPINAGSEVFADRRAYYYVNTQEKNIYLTFDCGYENGYTGKILDVLKAEGVKALFFVTKPYIADNVDLVKRMKREGHLVGNHTCRHLSTPSLSPKEISQELADCAVYMREKTGYSMDRYFRPPMGEWSPRTLKVVQDLGYTTVFWSMAFMDYDVNQQPGADAIKKQFLDYYHNGAIPLLHVISESDTEALGSIIQEMKKKGYSFHTLCELAQKEQEHRLILAPRTSASNPVRAWVQGKKGDDDVRILYYRRNGEVLSEAPREPGVYYVRAFVGGNSEYRPWVSAMKKFTICRTRRHSSE